MGNVTIGFSTDPKSWVSKVIRWFTKSQCSHTFVMLDTEPLGRLIVESDAGGVQVQTWDHFNTPGNTIVHAVTPDMDLVPALKQAMTEYLNEEYDYLGVIGMAWVMLWRRFKKKVSNPLHNSHEMFCSTFVARLLQIAKYPGTEKLTPGNTMAQDVWDLLDGKLVET